MWSRIKKYGSILLGIILVAAVMFYWEIIHYGFLQAQGQINILWNAKPIEIVLADSLVPDSLKRKIRLIQDVKEYAVQTGLSPSNNYTTYFDQHGKTLLWNLSACQKHTFIPKQWSFPFLGSFPYKGYFDLQRAKREELQLQKKGYDTHIRSVSGWSTLGWAKDPILSNMLNKMEGTLAELIIHELVHSTIFVKNNVVFNENLAAFIGVKGAEQYLMQHDKENPQFLTTYKNQKRDSKTYIQFMLQGARRLDSLYQSFVNESEEVKNKMKDDLIDHMIISIDSVSFHNQNYNKIFSNFRPNNAYFMTFLRYHSVEDSLNDIYHHNFKGNLNAFIKEMIDKHPH